MKRTGARAMTEGSITAAAKAVGMGRGLSPKSTSGLLGFAAFLLIEQIVLFFALLDRDIELGTYVALHLFCSLVLVCYLVWHPGAIGERDLSALQIVGWSAVAGPFGAFVAMALTFPRAAVATDSEAVLDTSTDALTDDRSTMGRPERMHTVLLDRRARLQDTCRVRPLIDAVVEGSRSEKLEALSIAYRKYEAKLSVLLKRALQDHDTSVRVLAATVIAKLHATYGQNIGDRQVLVASDPDVAHNWRQLAESRLAYAESSLLERARARAQVETAMRELTRAVELDPADAACATCLSRARRLLTYGERIDY
jgi:hypothetical protein